MNEIEEAISKVNKHMRLYYHKTLDDLNITDTPGYWEDKEAKMHPGHPLHGCLFYEGPFKATYRFLDKGRDAKGRFSSPYKTWKLLYNYFMHPTKLPAAVNRESGLKGRLAGDD